MYLPLGVIRSVARRSAGQVWWYRLPLLFSRVSCIWVAKSGSRRTCPLGRQFVLGPPQKRFPRTPPGTHVPKFYSLPGGSQTLDVGVSLRCRSLTSQRLDPNAGAMRFGQPDGSDVGLSHGHVEGHKSPQSFGFSLSPVTGSLVLLRAEGTWSQSCGA